MNMDKHREKKKDQFFKSIISSQTVNFRKGILLSKKNIGKNGLLNKPVLVIELGMGPNSIAT